MKNLCNTWNADEKSCITEFNLELHKIHIAQGPMLSYNQALVIKFTTNSRLYAAIELCTVNREAIKRILRINSVIHALCGHFAGNRE